MSLDESLFLAINGLAGRSEFFDHLFLRLSATSTLYLPVACAAGYWIMRRRWEALLGSPFLAGAIGLSDFLGGQLKWVFARVRPAMRFTRPSSSGAAPAAGSSVSLPTTR